MFPPPVKPAPSTRTLWISASGASERTMPAQAVPWPQTSPSRSLATNRRPSSSFETATALSTWPTSGCEASTPLSRMQTRTPLPVEPPQAHSRVTSAGQSASSAISFAAPAGRLQAGSSLTRRC